MHRICIDDLGIKLMGQPQRQLTLAGCCRPTDYEYFLKVNVHLTAVSYIAAGRLLCGSYGQFPRRVAFIFIFMVCPWLCIFMVAS